MQPAALDVSIINNCPTYSGIGRYTNELYSLLSPYFSLGYFTLPLTDGDEFPGKIVKRKTTIPFTSGWFFGSMFTKTAFDVALLNGLLHYGSAMIRPWTEDGIVTVLDLIPLSFGNNRLEKLVLKRNLKVFKNFSFVTAISERVKNELASRKFPEENLHTIYPNISKSFFPINDVEKSKLRREIGIPADKKLVISVSGATKNKNIEMISRIAKDLSGDCQIIHVGSSVDGVLNLNNLPNEVLNKLYNSADVFLAPSLDEGFGYPPIEAQKTGLPVVANDIDIFRETLGDSAVLVKNSEEEYLKGINYALKDDSFRKKSLINSSRFTAEKFVSDMKAIYQDAIKLL